MGFINRIKVFVSIVMCIVTGGNFFGGTLNYIRAGNINMIKNDHTKAFATEYTELVSYPSEHEDTISWFDGMVSGNGENVLLSGDSWDNEMITEDLIKCIIKIFDSKRSTPEIQSLCLDMWDDLYQRCLKSIKPFVEIFDNIN